MVKIKKIKYAFLIGLLLLLGGCAAERYRQEGLAMLKEGRLEEGISQLSKAQKMEPGNASLKKDFLLQRDAITLKLMSEANHDRSSGNWEAALGTLNRLLIIDPNHQSARQVAYDIQIERKQISRLDEATLLIKKGDFNLSNEIISKVLVEAPNQALALKLKNQILDLIKTESLNGPELNLRVKKPVTLQFRDANLKMVMEAISKTTGLNIIFDKDVKSDIKVTIFVRDTPVEEAIDLILLQSQTTKRVMGESSILIYPDTEIKAREYAELKIRRFSLTNADPKQVMAMVKTMTKTKDMFIDEKTNALIIRDSPQIIRLVEKLVATMDQPEPEVMLEVDVMEVSRDRLMSLGIDLPTSFGATTNGMSLQQLRNLTSSNFTVGGNITLQAKKVDAEINDLATPRIRVRNKEKAKFLVGDRLPVISTSAVPSTTATAPVYNTTVQYVEVGIKIEVEPTIYTDGEVAIRLSLEVSSAGEQNPTAALNGTIAYPISTRSINTVLRLKDGQTEIIGGLIQDQDRANATRLPGLGDIPILGRLFGIQSDTKNKKEIVLSITPRIVRNNRQAEGYLLEMWSGTENNMRFGSKALGNPKLQSPVNTIISTPVIARSIEPTLSSTEILPEKLKATSKLPRPVDSIPIEKLSPISIQAPKFANPGSQLSVLISLPELEISNVLELGLVYDSSRLKLSSLTESESERNLKNGNIFTSNSEVPGMVRIELNASRGGSLPTNGGALAQLKFDVLQAPGAAQLAISSAKIRSETGSEKAWTSLPIIDIDIKEP